MKKHRSPRRYSPEFTRDFSSITSLIWSSDKGGDHGTWSKRNCLGTWSRAETAGSPKSQDDAEKKEAARLRKRIKELEYEPQDESELEDVLSKYLPSADAGDRAVQGHVLAVAK